jgi:serine phosphatase RsbU (regulator of sigma subunit)
MLLFLLPLFAIAEQQNKYVDSLESVVRNSRDNSEKYSALRLLLKEDFESETGKAELHLKAATVIAEQSGDSLDHASAKFLLGYAYDQRGEQELAKKAFTEAIRGLTGSERKKELADACNLLAGVYFNSGDYREAIKWFTASQDAGRGLGNELLDMRNIMYSGMAYNQMGERVKGIELLQQSLRIAEKHKSKLAGHILLFIGSAYSESSSQDYAMTYFKKCEQMALRDKDTLLLLEANMYIANNHYYSKEYEKAIEIYSKVEELAEEQQDLRVYAGALGNLGNVYAAKGEHKKALEYQNRALEIFEKEGDNQGLTICYSAIGSAHYMLKDYKQSIAYYNKALVLANRLNSMEDLIEIHEGFSKTYEAIHDYKNAFENYKLFKLYNDSIYNEGNTKRITELELNNRFESQRKEQELLNQSKEAIANEKLKRQKLLSYTSITGVVLLLLIVGIVFRSSAQRKKANERLHEYNVAVLQQKEVIEYKNKEITDSINYAKRIQESILPMRDEIRQAFPESFVLFKPRDVVSGDFYWFTRQHGKNIIACVDCTGHGVPGAFMSMIGNTLLNEIVNEKGITQPAEILTLLHERVRQSLKQDLISSETRDGMDIAICSFDSSYRSMQYAGANRSLVIVREGRIIEVKADKQAIGGDQVQESRRFSNHELSLHKGDAIYMSTDGYADQFGGERGKKYMVKRFHQSLLEIENLNMEEQGKKLLSLIEEWQGNNEQVDDILVIGIRAQ